MNLHRKIIFIIEGSCNAVYCLRRELIKTMLENGCPVLVSAPYDEKLDLMNNIPFVYDNCKIDRRGTNIINDIKLFLHYLFLLKKHHPSIVLTYTAKPNIYASIAAHYLKIPVINNITGFGSVVNKKGLMQKFIMSLFKLAYSYSACLMFQNKSNLELAKKMNMIKGDYALIPGSGVNINHFSLQPYPNGGYGKNGETVIFNYIGRVLHEKGIDDYIYAAKFIKQKYPKTEFNVIGSIEYTESHYKKEFIDLEKHDIVIYRGDQKDVKPWISRSHCIIHPSFYGEGMSNVLLENASSGRPIITTDNPGCRETVNDNVTGFIYHSKNRDELIIKIEKFLLMNNLKRKEMGINGREKVKNEFSRDIVIKTYLSKIEEIIKNEL